jgi:site-specific DNA-cytosine methylase
MNELLFADKPSLKMLDCFCGMGGVSDGFALEGFDVTGIDIEDAPEKLGYKHKFIQADITTLKGDDFCGYDVIWGSPPCRNFSIIAETLGYTWKVKPNPEAGLTLVRAYRDFVEQAQPHFWIMENVSLLRKHYKTEKAQFTAPLGKSMYRSFWGNFPPFLMSRGTKVLTRQMANGKMTHFKGERGLANWSRAKIPLSCSRAFAFACKEALIEREVI